MTRPSAEETPRGSWARRLRHPLAIAALVYVAVEIVLWFTSARETRSEHTPFNHFALLADGWLHGRLDLGGPAPDYTGNNDFALKDGKTFVSFPPVPGLLILPLVWLSGSAEATHDGAFFIAFAALGPAVLFLALDKLSRAGRSRRTLLENLVLTGAFAFGTVFWFSAVQGTVWFAAHAVAVVFIAGYLYASIDADHPLLAGLMLGLAIGTRTPLFFALPLFVFELVRATHRGKITDAYFGFDPRALFRKAALFALPLALILAALAWHNEARFGDPFEFGHRYLQIVWQKRIAKWGLFSLHYLGRNLGVALTSTPFFGVKGAPMMVSAHGLALTITSPFFAWAIWPRRSGDPNKRALFRAIAISAGLVAFVDLLYQNSGWIQFGYRFSNDFSVFVIALIALSGRRFGAVFATVVGLAVAINAWGALTFGREEYAKYYFIERTQTVIYEPD